MIKIYYEDSAMSMTKNIYIIKEMNGKRYIAEPLVLSFKELEEGRCHDPTMGFYGLEGKEVLLDLKKAFAEGVENEEIKAVKYHLEDMRSLVFNSSARETKEREDE